MFRKCVFLCFLMLGFLANAQRDSVFVQLHLDEKTAEIAVKQRIVYQHQLENSTDKIQLFNWLSAYQNRKTPLARRKLEEGKTALHFAKKRDLGEIKDLSIFIENQEVKLETYQENIEIPLTQFLAKGERKELSLQYRIKLPNAQFTGYGRRKEEFLLKYFLLVPNHFGAEKFYQDLEENQYTGAFWNIEAELPQGYFMQSNLAGENAHFQGILNIDLEISLTKNPPQNLWTEVDGQSINVMWAYPITAAERSRVEFYMPLHLKFMKEKLGWLPSKIFINAKQKKKWEFLGSNDFQVFGKRLSAFSEAEKVDLDYFSVSSQQVLEQTFLVEKNKEHWLKNGLKTYLEIQYLRQFYANTPLLGSAREWRFLGLQPLKWSHLSKLQLIDRYGVAYHYLMSKNKDQAIGIDFEKLSDENQVVASQFEMGGLLDFVAQKVGKKKFEHFLKKYVLDHQGKEVKGTIFIENLVNHFGQSFDFIKDYLAKKQRVDFRLEEMKHIDNEDYHIKISKNTPKNIPLQLKVKDKLGKNQTFWLDMAEGKTENEYKLTLNQPQKLTLNPNYSFLEHNFRNNFSERRWFGFAKKLKVKFLTDVPNQEFNEVYITPDVRFNIYDDLLVGLNFSNSSLISSPFSYVVTPYFSIGEWYLTGSAGLSYKIQPVDAFFRNLTLGASGAYFHYNHNLSYRKIKLYSVLDFAQKERSMIDQSLNLSYQYIDQDLPNDASLSQNYAYYGLWNLGFKWRDQHPIHEKYFSANIQARRDVQKLSLEGIYEWQLAPKRHIQFRLFGGLFLKNEAKNRQFNFGVSRIYDYNFEHSLLGQSAVSGLYAQEFILAEGGFKSYVGNDADQWLTALNVDASVWKVFNVYADAGFYKNKGQKADFVWDSGVKIKLIPNVLEVYFPMQSSLGFEPAMKRYERRIRFSLSLDLDNVLKAVKRLR